MAPGFCSGVVRAKYLDTAVIAQRSSDADTLPFYRRTSVVFTEPGELRV